MDPYQNPPGMPGPAAVTPPAEQVSGPAILLMVTAGLGAVLALLSAIYSLAMGGQEIPPELAADPNVGRYLPFIQKMQTFGSFSNFVALVLCGVTFYGALKMKNLQAFNLSLAAAIIAVVPCFQPCCCLGIPAGIWALIVLNKPEVKAAFRP